MSNLYEFVIFISMCYDAEAQARRVLRDQMLRGATESDRKKAKAEYERLWGKELFQFHHVSGFSHPKILVFTDKDPYLPQAFNWGLIPSWIKDEAGAKKSMRDCLNARGETIFSKPSFRTSAKNKRCLVVLDAFYEHHHLDGKTFPFRISYKDDSPMVIAGLWEEWANPLGTGEIIQTFTIVTTVGNPIMSKIHNNPKAEMGPRMPVILQDKEQDTWLNPNATKEEIEALINPLDETLLKFHTVKRLRGKEYIGNKPEITEVHEYAEIEWS